MQTDKIGVDTYNKDNRDNKENKDNYCERDNQLSSIPLGIASDEALKSESESQMPAAGSQERGALPHLYQAGAPTPLDADQIKSCLMQVFDNGEAARQRYKFKIRLNLTDGTNPEFIASLTKDMRNFKKYIPEPYRQDIIKMAEHVRRGVKEQYDTIAYVGKLHMIIQNDPRGTRQIEPDTFVGIWWNAEDRGWSGIVHFQNWSHEFDLMSDSLSPKQRSTGVKAQVQWQNPKYDTRQRPQTWAQQRGLV